VCKGKGIRGKGQSRKLGCSYGVVTKQNRQEGQGKDFGDNKGSALPRDTKENKQIREPSILSESQKNELCRKRETREGEPTMDKDQALFVRP